MSGIVTAPVFCQNIKNPEFAGQFYPDSKTELSALIDSFLNKAHPEVVPGDIFLLISPHAGYGYSGQTAAFGYKELKGKKYKTVIILGASHHEAFNGAVVFTQGSFLTSLGKLEVDEDFTKQLIQPNVELIANDKVFSGEHSIEVQLPFLEQVLSDFRIVPIIVGDCTLQSCQKIAATLAAVIGKRQDVLVVVSSDMYHGYSSQEANAVDGLTLSYLQKMDAQGLYYSLREGKSQLCGGFAAVVGLIIAQELGYTDLKILNHTNSAIVTGKENAQDWTVGYASCAVFNPQGGKQMFNLAQQKKLLKIAREAIAVYLKQNEKLILTEADPELNKHLGAFVTLSKAGELRGCIGNLVGAGALYLTVRDMALEAATRDPRFPKLSLNELPKVEIEISVLSPLERIYSVDKIELGKHGVLVRQGNRSGVFLPQVAKETGWSKEEFLNQLCSQKAGLAPDAWKDKSTELYTFSAEVFSEKGTKE